MTLITTSQLNFNLTEIEADLEGISIAIEKGILQDGITIGHLISKFQLIASITKRISTQLIKENESRIKNNNT